MIEETRLYVYDRRDAQGMKSYIYISIIIKKEIPSGIHLFNPITKIYT